MARLPFAVRALLVGDLPINLWWASNKPPPFAGALLFDLAEHAQQIVYDSRGWLEPTRAVAGDSPLAGEFRQDNARRPLARGLGI